MQLFSLLALATFALGAPSFITDDISPVGEKSVSIEEIAPLEEAASIEEEAPVTLISDPIEVAENSTIPVIKLEAYQETIKKWFKRSKVAVDKIKVHDGQIYAYYPIEKEWDLAQSISIDKSHRVVDGVIEEYHNLKWRAAIDFQIDIRHHAIDGLVCFWNRASKTWDRVEDDYEIMIKDDGSVVKDIVKFFEVVEHKVENGLIYVWNGSKHGWEMAKNVSISASHRVVDGSICAWNKTTQVRDC
jgi:hypothetical protein